MTDPADTVRNVRTLHSPPPLDPKWVRSYLTCRGCDVEGWEADEPEWPCRTAQIVYTADEIAATKTAHADAFTAWQQNRPKVNSRTPWVPEIWQAQIAASLLATSKFVRPFE